MERRDFLKAGLGGVAASYFSSALMLATPKRAEAAVVEFFFTAQEVLKTVTNNKQILTWQFVDPLTTPLGNLTSNIIVNQGDTVIVHVTNALPSTVINFKVPGLLDESATVEPGQTQAYEFVATQAGSYVYYDENNGLIGRAMGLAGPLVVMPQDGSAALYDNAPPEHQFARQYTLLFQEMDSRINDAVTAGLTPDMSTFQPEFFFVNGLSYPNTVYDATGAIDDSKVIYMMAHENVALRFINGGLIYYPMHFHGYHTNVVLRNREPELYAVEKDTVQVRVGECVDTVLPVGEQTGLYPLHTHYVPGVTTNGRYPGGGLLMMKAV